jgi:hypothetical protein
MQQRLDDSLLAIRIRGDADPLNDPASTPILNATTSRPRPEAGGLKPAGWALFATSYSKSSRQRMSAPRLPSDELEMSFTLS